MKPGSTAESTDLDVVSLHIHISHRSQCEWVQIGFLTSGKEVLVSVVTVCAGSQF